MADCLTRFTFKLPANQTDAEALCKLIEADHAIKHGKELVIERQIVEAFRDTEATPEVVLRRILADGPLGIEFSISHENGDILIEDHGGSPNLLALAECLQRLFPEKIPLGFTYTTTCTKWGESSFSGGYIAICADTIEQTTFDELLDNRLAALERSKR